jgi:hypothetical protein
MSATTNKFFFAKKEDVGKPKMFYITFDCCNFSQARTRALSVLPGPGPCRPLACIASHGIGSPSPSGFATDGQSASLSWCRAPSGTHDQMFSLGSDHYSMSRHVASCLTRGRVCHLSHVLVFVKSVHTYILHSICTHIEFIQLTMYNIYMASVSPGNVQQIMPYLIVHSML